MNWKEQNFTGHALVNHFNVMKLNSMLCIQNTTETDSVMAPYFRSLRNLGSTPLLFCYFSRGTHLYFRADKGGEMCP